MEYEQFIGFLRMKEGMSSTGFDHAPLNLAYACNSCDFHNNLSSGHGYGVDLEPCTRCNKNPHKDMSLKNMDSVESKRFSQDIQNRRDELMGRKYIEHRNATVGISGYKMHGRMNPSWIAERNYAREKSMASSRPCALSKCPQKSRGMIVDLSVCKVCPDNPDYDLSLEEVSGARLVRKLKVY